MSEEGAMRFNRPRWEGHRIAPIFFMEASFPTSYIQCGPLRLNRVLELTLLYKPDD